MVDLAMRSKAQQVTASTFPFTHIAHQLIQFKAGVFRSGLTHVNVLTNHDQLAGGAVSPQVSQLHFSQLWSLVETRA
jgi:hypothetical protein